MRTRRRSMLLPDVQKCAEQMASHPLELKRHGKLAGQLSAVWKGNLFARPKPDDDPAVVASVDRAGDVVARSDLRPRHALGPTWPCGVELSFGQSWNLKNRLVVAQ
jgi:hypothetical protein